MIFFLNVLCFAEYFAALGTVRRYQSSQLPFTPQLSRDPSNHFKNLPSVVIRLWTLPDHHSGEKYTKKGVLHHICQSMGLVRKWLFPMINFVLLSLGS